MANDPRKRLRYFTGQFLQEQDFKDEQAYHIERQRRHNRTLHTPGVADDGLIVTPDGPFKAKVSPGTAIDGEGRQIILTPDDPQGIDLSSFANKKVLVVISYGESDSDLAQVGDKQNTRILEQGSVQPIANEDSSQFPANRYIRLALLEIDDKGNIKPDDSVRMKAGAKGGATELEKKLDEHIKNQNNPHNVTAAQIKALPTSGGTVRGSVNITTNGVKNKLDVRTENEGIFENANSRISDTGSVFVLNTKPKSYGLVAKITDTDLAMPNQISIPPAAVVAISGFDNANAIYATAKTGNHALYVEGTARIGSKDLATNKDAANAKPALAVIGYGQATGGFSTGHIVDTFINASGKRLRTGDVVKLKGTPVTRFQGEQNKIPVAEVTLADQENDTLVIGIVDREAFPEPETTDTRVEPEDPSFIEDGGDLYVVTIGVFAHCKVDATEAHIEVGDLLTTSNNPGYAKKATEPKLGSIIGKALAPLREGTGEIAVFVNIQ